VDRQTDIDIPAVDYRRQAIDQPKRKYLTKSSSTHYRKQRLGVPLQPDLSEN